MIPKDWAAAEAVKKNKAVPMAASNFQFMV
jgi:hypothetical protein